MKEVCAILQEQWVVIVVAVTSDASSKSRKARKLLIKECPELLGLDCYVHQVCIVSVRPSPAPQLNHIQGCSYCRRLFLCCQKYSNHDLGRDGE